MDAEHQLIHPLPRHVKWQHSPVISARVTPALGLLSDVVTVTCDFSDGDAGLRGSLQVHVVAANAGSERQLELWRLGDALRGEVPREERRCDDLRTECVDPSAEQALQESSKQSACSPYVCLGASSMPQSIHIQLCRRS